jgi:Flp pilus assembly pilin Flp
MRRLKTLTKNFLAEEDGAIIAEYGLLIAILVAGMIVAIGAYRTNIANWLNTLSSKITNAS